VPFYGKAHVAYIPNHYITGLSKLQGCWCLMCLAIAGTGKINNTIKECIQTTLQPLGVALNRGYHMCLQMRGVKKQNSITTTSDFTGAFLKEATRKEFLSLIDRNKL
jgi:GTP cyclohydrolase I